MLAALQITIRQDQCINTRKLGKSWNILRESFATIVRTPAAHRAKPRLPLKTSLMFGSFIPGPPKRSKKEIIFGFESNQLAPPALIRLRPVVARLGLFHPD